MAKSYRKPREERTRSKDPWRASHKATRRGHNVNLRNAAHVAMASNGTHFESYIEDSNQ